MIFSILHSFVNIFADGYSNIKTILFFVYLISLGLIYLLFKNKPIKRLKWKYFGITILVMYLYGLALQIVYTISNKLPFNRAFVTGNNGEISYSAIFHIHISKAVIGIIFPHLNNIDAGGAYLNLFPNWLFLLGSVLLIIILFQAIIYFTTSFRATLKNYKTRQVIFLILGYALLSFSLIKTSVDGGILHPAFIVSSLFVIIFILKNKNKLPSYHYYLSTIVALILLLINRYLNFLTYGSGWVFIQTATLILFYNLILYCNEKKINYRIVVLFILLFLTSWWFYAFRDLGIYKYSNISLPANRSIYFYNKNKNEIDSIRVGYDLTILQVSKKLNKNLNYLPIAVTNINCKENTNFKKSSFTLVSEKPIKKNSLLGSSNINIVNTESLKSGKKWKTDLTIYRKSCLLEKFSVVDGLLKKNNINPYIYYNFFDL